MPFIALLLAVAAMPPPHYVVNAKVDRSRGAIAADVSIEFPSAPAETKLVFGETYSVERGSLTLHNSRPGSPATMRVRYAGVLAPSGEPPLNIISQDLVELNLDSLWVPLVYRLQHAIYSRCEDYRYPFGPCGGSARARNTHSQRGAHST